MTERICELYGDISLPEAIHTYFERLYTVSPSEVKDKLDEKDILLVLPDVGPDVEIPVIELISN